MRVRLWVRCTCSCLLITATWSWPCDKTQTTKSRDQLTRPRYTTNVTRARIAYVSCWDTVDSCAARKLACAPDVREEQVVNDALRASQQGQCASAAHVELCDARLGLVEEHVDTDGNHANEHDGRKDEDEEENAVGTIAQAEVGTRLGRGVTHLSRICRRGRLTSWERSSTSTQRTSMKMTNHFTAQ